MALTVAVSWVVPKMLSLTRKPVLRAGCAHDSTGSYACMLLASTPCTHEKTGYRCSTDVPEPAVLPEALVHAGSTPGLCEGG